MSRRSKPTLVKTWRDRIDRYEDAEQTVAQFCESENVSVPSFYQWKKRLTELATNATSHSVNANSSDGPAAALKTVPAFSEVAFAPASTRPTMIRLTNGAIIELGNDMQLVETILNCVLASNSDAAVATEKPAC